MSELLFREYHWASLWQQRKLLQESHWHAIVSAAWWREPTISCTDHGKLKTQLLLQRDAGMVFTIGLTALCQGNASASQLARQRLHRLKAPRWMSGWLEIEELGRARQFEKQAKLISTLPADENWPFSACLQSLYQDVIDPRPLLSLFSSHAPKCTVGKILLARLLAEREDFDEATQLLQTQLEKVELHADHRALAAFYLGYVEHRAHNFAKAKAAWDIAAAGGFIDLPGLENWTAMVLSFPEDHSSILKRVQQAAFLLPENSRTYAEFATYALIVFWISGHYEAAYNTAATHRAFQDMPKDERDQNAQVFFRYILLLCEHWQHNQAIYLSEKPLPPLHVIGESHALSMANVKFIWNGCMVHGRSHLVLGATMWKLQRPEFCQREAFMRQLEALPSDADVIVCVGEIDCRPNGGIWIAVRKLKRSLLDVIEETVDGYLAFLHSQLAHKAFASFTVQGIPAPGYPLREEFDPGDKTGFLSMIKEVNIRLEQGAISRGWQFLDVYTATANEQGTSNRLWHLDPHHLKPKFYVEAERWISKSC